MKKIIMDFITKLFGSRNSMIKELYKLTMVMIDKLIKYIHFIPIKKTFDIEQLRYFLFN